MKRTRSPRPCWLSCSSRRDAALSPFLPTLPRNTWWECWTRQRPTCSASRQCLPLRFLAPERCAGSSRCVFRARGSWCGVGIFRRCRSGFGALSTRTPGQAGHDAGGRTSVRSATRRRPRSRKLSECILIPIWKGESKCKPFLRSFYVSRPSPRLNLHLRITYSPVSRPARASSLIRRLAAIWPRSRP